MGQQALVALTAKSSSKDWTFQEDKSRDWLLLALSFAIPESSSSMRRLLPLTHRMRRLFSNLWTRRWREGWQLQWLIECRLLKIVTASLSLTKVQSSKKEHLINLSIIRYTFPTFEYKLGMINNILLLSWTYDFPIFLSIFNTNAQNYYKSMEIKKMKVVIVGHSGVGKTSIISRYVN